MVTHSLSRQVINFPAHPLERTLQSRPQLLLPPPLNPKEETQFPNAFQSVCSKCINAALKRSHEAGRLQGTPKSILEPASSPTRDPVLSSPRTTVDWHLWPAHLRLIEVQSVVTIAQYVPLKVNDFEVHGGRLSFFHFCPVIHCTYHQSL